MWKILLLTGLFYVAILATNLGYNIDYGRSEVLFYEKSLVNNPYFFFGRYNRTNFCLNVSFQLLEDLDGNHIKSTTSVHQLRNGHYSPLGIELTYNVCHHYKKNIFGIKTQLAQYGNLTACDIKKGFYYMYNFMPDESFFPKAIPFGDYMIQMDVRRDSGEALLKFSWYVSAKFILPTRRSRKRI